MDATNKSNGKIRCRKPLPISSAADIQWYGQMISQTEFFGKINPADGATIVAMCHMNGWTLSEFMENYNVMHKRLAKKTDAIIVDFDNRGGTKEVVSRTPEIAEVKLALGKTKYVSKIEWKDCLKEPFIYEGRQETVLVAIQHGKESTLQIKAKYATPRSRMQMLWARAISDGVRVVCPSCVQGIYTPEEIDDFDDAIENESHPQQIQVQGTVSPSPVAAAPAPAAGAPAPAAAPAAAAATAVNSIEVCPVGPAAGKRWDDESVFSVEVLKQALGGNHPLLTPEMKDYIRGLVEKREPVAVPAAAEVVNG